MVRGFRLKALFGTLYPLNESRDDSILEELAFFRIGKILKLKFDEAAVFGRVWLRAPLPAAHRDPRGEAETIIQDLLQRRRRVFGPAHPPTAWCEAELVIVRRHCLGFE